MKTVWVANREIPMKYSSAYLNITMEGNLVITDSNGTFMITIYSKKPVMSSNTNVTLLDSDNLVLKARGKVLTINQIQFYKA